jgi:hypothetical protein
VRNFTTLHELFRVYVDPDGVLRTDHKISFVGLTILRLHYKMTPWGNEVGRLQKRQKISPQGTWCHGLGPSGAKAHIWELSSARLKSRPPEMPNSRLQD